MQRIRKLTVSLKRVYNRLWTLFLLLWSVTILVFFVLGISLPLPLILLFSLFVPGYAIVSVLFHQLRNLEKVFMSIGFSMALFVGIKSFIQTFAFVGLLSELGVLTIISAVCLIAKLIR